MIADRLRAGMRVHDVDNRFLGHVVQADGAIRVNGLSIPWDQIVAVDEDCVFVTSLPGPSACSTASWLGESASRRDVGAPAPAVGRYPTSGGDAEPSQG